MPLSSFFPIFSSYSGYPLAEHQWRRLPELLAYEGLVRLVLGDVLNMVGLGVTDGTCYCWCAESRGAHPQRSGDVG